MDENIDLYNKIFTDKPTKWDQEYRDKFAFYVLSRHTEQPDTLLDIGCGSGHTIEFFSKRWPDTSYFGIDLSDEAIKFARKRVPEAEFICDTFDNLYVEKQPKDVAVVMGVAEHFENLVDSLSLLKKFGKLIYLEVPNCLRCGIINGSDNYDEGFRQTFYGTDQMEWHLKRSSWEERISMAGLEIIKSYPGPTVETEFIWMLK